MLILMTTSTSTLQLLNSESSNILTPISTILSSSLSPINQTEKFDINDTKKIIDIDATWKFSGLSKEVNKEEGKEQGKELEQKDTKGFNPIDF